MDSTPHRVEPAPEAAGAQHFARCNAAAERPGAFERMLAAMREDAAWFQDLRQRLAPDGSMPLAGTDGVSQGGSATHGVLAGEFDVAIHAPDARLAPSPPSPHEHAAATAAFAHRLSACVREAAAAPGGIGRFEVSHPRLGRVVATLALEPAADPRQACLCITLEASRGTRDTLASQRTALTGALELATGRAVSLTLASHGSWLHADRDD